MTVEGSDLWADAPTLPFGSSSAPTTTVGKGIEAGEYTGYGNSRSMWWKVVIPDGLASVNFDVLQTDYGIADPYDVWVRLTVFEDGPSVDALTVVEGANYAYDYTNTYTTNLAETDIYDLPGGTYCVRASVPSWSIDANVVLRVAESQFPWTDWEDRTDTYEVTDVTTTGNSFRGSGSNSQTPAEMDADHYQEALDAGLADPKEVGSVGGQLGIGYTVGLGYAFGPPDTSTYAAQVEGSLRHYGPAANTFATWKHPFNEYHWDWQYEGPPTVEHFWLQVGTPVERNIDNGGGTMDEASAVVGVIAVADPTALTSTPDTWDFEAATGATIHSWSIGGNPDSTEHPTGDIDLAPYLVDNEAAVKVNVLSGSIVHDPAPSAGGQLVLGSIGGGVLWVLKPSRMRYQDKVLVAASRRCPPLRQYPRNDGLAGSARRMWPPPRSTQGSIRRLGGYL